MDNKSKKHQEKTPSPSTLTIENVTKLELQYESADGDLLERRKVEEYIRKTQQFEQQHRNTLFSHSMPQTEDLNSMSGTTEDPCLVGKEQEMQIDSETKRKSKVPVDTNGKKPMINAEIYQYKSVQTQTEWSWSTLSPAISRTESAISEATSKNKSVDSVDIEDPESAEDTLNVEEHSLQNATEDHVSCDFCLKPKKPFPSVEQVISEPSSMLFCCVKSQELFQFLIMDTIQSYIPEETHGKKEILTKEDQDKNEFKEELEEKHSEHSQSTTPHISDEVKALNSLRDELVKVNTKDYIASLSNHMISYGSLFVTEKITFSLKSASDNMTHMQLDEPDVHLTPTLDDLFCSVLDSGLVKMPKKTIRECYNSGSSFLILFTDGTGQVFYPSGNIGILIARSKSAQLTFIVMEDMKYKPKLRAVFMSNGHAACYHPNGRLWAVLDPCGGVYFDENGTQQKQWAWWEFSQHVHAPPFQPITLKINSNTEVKMVTQDQIFLTFSIEKKKITLNVGSKLKDPESISQLKSRTDDAECYLCSKHLQISNLLNSIRDLLRISHSSHSTIEKVQEYVKQLQKSLHYITGLANKLSDSAEKHKKKSIQQNVTTVKKKPQPHKTPSLKIECNVRK